MPSEIEKECLSAERNGCKSFLRIYAQQRVVQMVPANRSCFPVRMHVFSELCNYVRGTTTFSSFSPLVACRMVIIIVNDSFTVSAGVQLPDFFSLLRVGKVLSICIFRK